MSFAIYYSGRLQLPSGHILIQRIQPIQTSVSVFLPSGEIACTGHMDEMCIRDRCKNAGVSLITSIHGSSRKDIEDSPLGQLLEQKVFKNIIYLAGEKGPGTVKEIQNA